MRQFSLSSRLATDVINPITVGEIGVSLFIVVLSYSSTAHAILPRWMRVSGRIAGGVLGIAVCVLSASKGPLLSLVAVVLVMFCYRLVRLFARQVQETCAVLVALALLAALAADLNERGVLTIHVASPISRATSRRQCDYRPGMVHSRSSTLHPCGAVPRLS